MNKKTPALDEKKVRILIFCPSEIILSGILRALEADAGIDIANVEKNTIDSFMESIKKLRPQVILFANTEPLPNMREICKAINEISKLQTKSQLLILGSIPSHEEIVGLINAGARGYFDLTDPAGQLSEAIRVIHKGEIWLPRDKMSSIMDRIISVVGQGKSNDEIAEVLFISKNTVRSHIKSIYAKLDTHSRLQLALYAINSALF
jgi:NarL family two-component system response regulator LiaR